LALAEPDGSGDVIIFSLKYGNTPMPNTANAVKPLMPGETTELVLSDNWYDQSKLSLEKNQGTPITKVNKADLELVIVYFDDDTAWRSGSLMRRDPNDPRKY